MRHHPVHRDQELPAHPGQPDEHRRRGLDEALAGVYRQAAHGERKTAVEKATYRRFDAAAGRADEGDGAGEEGDEDGEAGKRHAGGAGAVVAGPRPVGQRPLDHQRRRQRLQAGVDGGGGNPGNRQREQDPARRGNGRRLRPQRQPDRHQRQGRQAGDEHRARHAELACERGDGAHATAAYGDEHRLAHAHARFLRSIRQTHDRAPAPGATSGRTAAAPGTAPA